METALIIPAFIAGLLTFLAPCTLPLVPGYLGFVSGVSIADMRDPTKAKAAKRRIFVNGVFFMLGFSVILIALGTLVGFLGSVLIPYRIWLGRIGGIFVLLFGLFMLNIVKLPFLNTGRGLPAPAMFRRGKPINSFILGSAFAFGWTPCVGPVLGSILLLASTSTTALQGGLLLAVFSLGLAVPFLAIAGGVAKAGEYIARFGKFLNAVSVLGGLLLIFLGVLLLTDRMSYLVAWSYRALDLINYEKLLEYF